MDLNTKIHWTGYFFFWHRLITHKFEQALIDACGYKGTQPYWDWTLGALVVHLLSSSLSLTRTADAANIANSSIWDPDPESGLGLSTGDLSNDITMTTGGFANLSLAYPSRHILRRNLTEQPFLVLGNLWPDNPAEPLDFFQYVNYSITAEYVEAIVDGYRGDFKGFQAFFEGPVGPHGPPHWYLGGDSSSLCPKNYTHCNSPGPKWSNNGKYALYWYISSHSFFARSDVLLASCCKVPTFDIYMRLLMYVLKMTDKVYYDWQHRHPENFYSFHGGATQNLSSWETYSEYPNGQAPWLKVCFPSANFPPILKLWTVL